MCIRDRLPMLVPNPYSKISRTQFALAQDEVCYVGEPIAIVIADSRHLAEDAAAAVFVDYEPLGVSNDCRDAVKPGAPLAHADAVDNKAAAFTVSYGDVASAFRSAAHIY